MIVLFASVICDSCEDSLGELELGQFRSEFAEPLAFDVPPPADVAVGRQRGGLETARRPLPFVADRHERPQDGTDLGARDDGGFGDDFVLEFDPGPVRLGWFVVVQPPKGGQIEPWLISRFSSVTATGRSAAADSSPAPGSLPGPFP